MTTNSDPLKYRFVAEYVDGTILQQNAEDVSAVDPKRSAYFDVDHSRLRAFALLGKEHNFLVDLQDGHFEVDKVVFSVHDAKDAVPPFKLVFFRRHQNSIKMDYRVEQNGDTLWQRTYDPTHRVSFRLGWEAQTPSGDPVHRILEIE